MHEVQLKHPIVVGDGTPIEKLVFPERLKVKVLRKLPNWLFDGSVNKDSSANPAAYVPILSAVLDMPEATLDELDLEDLNPVVEEMNDFFGLYLPTGSSSSGE